MQRSLLATVRGDGRDTGHQQGADEGQDRRDNVSESRPGDGGGTNRDERNDLASAREGWVRCFRGLMMSDVCRRHCARR
jgi:hypothetical protein